MVPGSAFNRIADIAEMEERDMGGQVAYIVKNMCDHPQANREEVNIVVAFVHPPSVKNKAARVGKNQPYRGYFCNQCGKYVFTTPTQANATVADAMNAPMLGVAVD